MSSERDKLLETIRCPACRGELSFRNDEEELFCTGCNLTFPIRDGIPRLLLPSLRDALLAGATAVGMDAQQVETALSFGFEWHRFPEMYREWEQQFLDYMRPHGSDFFKGKKVLDAGCGNGRFAHYAAKYGAEVWAIDLGPAVEVAKRNTESAGVVNVVQADLHSPPFALESFDFIYSIGVLHHLPDPEAAFRSLLRFLKPGGEVQIYLYWKPERQPIKALLLTAVTGVRQLTTRLPHRMVHALSYPFAVGAFAFFVWPYRILRTVPALRDVAEKMPMKQYAGFPFRVCVNDQLDRFSAPIENRYTRADVEKWLKAAGLESPLVGENFGWIGTGRKAVEIG
ncbi:MAG: hypothetical protein C5B55_04285 [Blastocatellia bacterium]|nr:MAG: hypothetical protein C5B55_04285 [Blastocatellia bacterium]